MTISTLLSRILSKYGYDVVIYKGWSISSADYELWSGRNIDIPIGLIYQEVVDWAVNWLSNAPAPESAVVLTIVVL